MVETTRHSGDDHRALQRPRAVFLLKNARSVQAEERFEEMLKEIEGHAWDAVIVNEAWCELPEELIQLPDRSLWCGSGGTAGKHGVGVLQHRDWKLDNFKAISSRLCVVNATKNGVRLSLIVAYLPHGGYSDDAVEQIYDDISTQIGLARKDRRRIVLGGDWNAEVASATGNDIGAAGRFTNPIRSARGDWLAAWAQQHDFKIANKFFDKRWDNTWTHQQNGRQRVIDYSTAYAHSAGPWLWLPVVLRGPVSQVQSINSIKKPLSCVGSTSRKSRLRNTGLSLKRIKQNQKLRHYH